MISTSAIALAALANANPGAAQSAPTPPAEAAPQRGLPPISVSGKRKEKHAVKNTQPATAAPTPNALPAPLVPPAPGLAGIPATPLNTVAPSASSAEMNALAGRLGRKCDPAFVPDSDDSYTSRSVMPDAPVFRLVCGADWFHVDSSNGALLEKLDSSRRAYRWLFTALHTLDFHVLMVRPALRTTLIVVLCACGFVFSVTGIVIAWRRLLACFRSPQRR